MSTPIDDDELMRLLAEAEAARAGVSGRSRAAARAAYSWRTIDDELMELSFDSRLSDELLVRGAAPDTRVVGFRGSDFTLELENDEGQLLGQVVPGRTCVVTLLTRVGEVATVDTDESGFFTLPISGEAPWRLRVDLDGRVESTGWLPL